MREDSLIGTEMQSSYAPSEPEAHGEIYIKLASPNEAYWYESVVGSRYYLVRLKREFVYLAVVLDKFSRKVVGWNLDRTLTVRLPLVALENALKERKPAAGLVHHSDRGTQLLAH